MSEQAIYEQWFKKAMNMETGEKLYLPADGKAERTKLKNLMIFIRDSYKEKDAIEAAKIAIYPFFSAKSSVKYSVILEKRAFSPLVAFRKNEQTDELEKIVLSSDLGKSRRILLMIKDGYTREQIEENEGILSSDELKEFFGEEA
jgi:hypothetical protein